MKCEFRGPCCEAGHLCNHKSRRKAMQLNWHCEDLVNGDMCPFITGEMMESYEGNPYISDKTI